MRYGVWKSLIVAMLLAICTVSTVAHAAAPWADPQGRFSFTLPDGYKQGPTLPVPEGATGFQFVTTTPPGINFNIVSVDDPTNPQAGLTSLAVATTGELQQLFPDVTFGSEGILTIQVGGQEARQYTYYATVPNQNIRIRGVVVVALRGNTAYTLVFTARDENAQILTDTFGAIISSFKWNG